MPKANRAIGSRLDDLLAEDGLLDDVTALAIKRLVAWQIDQAMKARGISKAELARRMSTSRSMLDRLLSPDDTGLTIDTLSRAAQALGCRLRLQLTPG